MFVEYIYIITFFYISTFLVLILSFLSLFVKALDLDKEKMSTYECGFNPIGDTRLKFEISFYLISILFIIFDLEIALLFPWIVVLKISDFYTFIIVIFFFIILLIGFFFEWKKDALTWEQVIE